MKTKLKNPSRNDWAIYHVGNELLDGRPNGFVSAARARTREDAEQIWRKHMNLPHIAMLVTRWGKVCRTGIIPIKPIPKKMLGRTIHDDFQDAAECIQMTRQYLERVRNEMVRLWRENKKRTRTQKIEAESIDQMVQAAEHQLQLLRIGASAIQQLQHTPAMKRYFPSATPLPEGRTKHDEWDR